MEKINFGLNRSPGYFIRLPRHSWTAVYTIYIEGEMCTLRVWRHPVQSDLHPDIQNTWKATPSWLVYVFLSSFQHTTLFNSTSDHSPSLNTSLLYFNFFFFTYHPLLPSSVQTNFQIYIDNFGSSISFYPSKSKIKLTAIKYILYYNVGFLDSCSTYIHTNKMYI